MNGSYFFDGRGHQGRPLVRSLGRPLGRLTVGLLGLFGLVGLIGLMGWVLVGCGGPGAKSDDCPSGSASSRVDTTRNDCAVFGQGAWTDPRLAEVDGECVAYMSATDAPGQARLYSFCGCLSETVSKKVTYDEFLTSPDDAVADAYNLSGASCSVAAGYAVPSPAAGERFSEADYKLFMTDCRKTESPREACLCLVTRDAAKFVRLFHFSEERDVHACGVLREKNPE